MHLLKLRPTESCPDCGGVLATAPVPDTDRGRYALLDDAWCDCHDEPPHDDASADAET
jgi:hypothetical protein